MTLINLSKSATIVLNSKKSTFTVETKKAINIHETKDINSVLNGYLKKGIDNILTLKPGSNYGF